MDHETAEALKLVQDVDYMDSNTFAAFSARAGLSDADILLLSNNNFTDGKLLASILSKLSVKIAYGLALQLAINGFTASGNFNSRFTVDGQEYSVSELMGRIGAAPLSQNHDNSKDTVDITYGRICRAFAYGVRSFLVSNDKVYSALYRKHGGSFKNIPGFREHCFVGSEHVVHPNGNLAKMLILVQRSIDAKEAALGKSGDEPHRWESRMIDLLVARGMEPVPVGADLNITDSEAARLDVELVRRR